MKSILEWLPLGTVEETPAAELAKLLGDPSVQIIDVRTEVEFARSRIPGATNLPITRFTQKAVDGLQLDRERRTVCVCLSAHRSIPAVRQLRSMGFSRAVQLRGGMRAWWAAHHPCTESS
jgi:rhodanese-related sulfurtransferase